MKAVTIRGVEPEVAEKLKIVAKKQEKSVNHPRRALPATQLITWLGCNMKKLFNYQP